MPTENRSSNTMVSLPRDLVDLALAHLPNDSAAKWEIHDALHKPAEQHQGEPVALPDRKEVVEEWATPGGPYRAEGWNACLDEVAKLGTLYTRADPNVHWQAVADEQKQVIENLQRRIQNADLALKTQTQNCDTLRSQLADLRGMLRMAWGSDDISAEDCRRIDAAISASAEQSAPVERCATGYRCHECKAETQPPAPFKAYVVCGCGAKTAATAAQMVERDERAAFESWCVVIGYTLKTSEHGNGFKPGYGSELFSAWQARAALALKP